MRTTPTPTLYLISSRILATTSNAPGRHLGFHAWHTFRALFIHGCLYCFLYPLLFSSIGGHYLFRSRFYFSIVSLILRAVYVEESLHASIPDKAPNGRNALSDFINFRFAYFCFVSASCNIQCWKRDEIRKL